MAAQNITLVGEGILLTSARYQQFHDPMKINEVAWPGFAIYDFLTEALPILRPLLDANWEIVAVVCEASPRPARISLLRPDPTPDTFGAPRRRVVDLYLGTHEGLPRHEVPADLAAIHKRLDEVFARTRKPAPEAKPAQPAAPTA